MKSIILFYENHILGKTGAVAAGLVGMPVVSYAHAKGYENAKREVKIHQGKKLSNDDRTPWENIGWTLAGSVPGVGGITNAILANKHYKSRDKADGLNKKKK